jgi:hypothetical protein
MLFSPLEMAWGEVLKTSISPTLACPESPSRNAYSIFILQLKPLLSG